MSFQPPLSIATFQVEIADERRRQRQNDDPVADTVAHVCVVLIPSDRTSHRLVADA